MSLNSSANASVLHSRPPSLNNIYAIFNSCLTSSAGFFVFLSYTVANILLLLPFCVLVLSIGFLRWQRRRSATTLSYSDLMTYHMVVMEIINFFGSVFSSCAAGGSVPELMGVGICLMSINVNGQILFHILTCVDRYLAVVHPVTYMVLKKGRGIRIRNVTIGCIWLSCLANAGTLMLVEEFSLVLSYFSLSVVIIIITLCSVSVLCVLIRSGPAGRVSQSKRKAFYIITAIMAVLLVKFGLNIFATSRQDSEQVEGEADCVFTLLILWGSLPSSLVLPLLFLQRAGKRMCCRNNSKSGVSGGSD